MSEGPCAPPSSPGSAEWQMLHCWRNSALPAAASAPKAGVLANTIAAAAPDNTPRIDGLMPSAPGTARRAHIQVATRGFFRVRFENRGEQTGKPRLQFQRAHAAGKIHAAAFTHDQAGPPQGAVVLRAGRFRHRELEVQCGLRAVHAARGLHQLADYPQAYGIGKRMQNAGDGHV